MLPIQLPYSLSNCILYVPPNKISKKLELFKLCQKKKLNLSRVAYVGNDINDLEVMQEVGFPIAPNDGEMHIKEIAKIITKKNGGFGVIRELLDLLEK